MYLIMMTLSEDPDLNLFLHYHHAPYDGSRRPWAVSDEFRLKYITELWVESIDKAYGFSDLIKATERAEHYQQMIKTHQYKCITYDNPIFSVVERVRRWDSGLIEE